MVAMSQMWQEPVNRITCACLIHPRQTCLQFLLGNHVKLVCDMLKYYSPIVIMPLLLHVRRRNPALLYKALRQYLLTTACASTTMTAIFLHFCLFRRFFGKFYESAFLFGPVSCGTLLCCWWYPNRIFNLFFVFTLKAALEVARSQSALLQFLWHSELLQTLLFMASSGIILEAKRLGNCQQFWVLLPAKELPFTEPAIAKPTISEILRSVWPQLKSSILLGLALDVLSVLLSAQKGTPLLSAQFASNCWAKLRNQRFNMTRFFVVYDAVYKLSLHLLRVQDSIKLSFSQKHLLAGFLGGCSYKLLPKIGLVVYAVILATQSLWQRFCHEVQERQQNTPAEVAVPSPGAQQKKQSPPQRLLKLLCRVPFARLLFPIQCGYIAQMYFFHPYLLSRMTTPLLAAMTNHRLKAAVIYLGERDVLTLMRENALSNGLGFFR